MIKYHALASALSRIAVVPSARMRWRSILAAFISLVLVSSVSFPGEALGVGESPTVSDSIADNADEQALEEGLRPSSEDEALSVSATDDEVAEDVLPENEGDDPTFVVPDALSLEEPQAQLAESYQSGITDANMHQLVIVVRFAGDAVGDGDTGLNAPYANDSGTTWQRHLDSFNGEITTKYQAPTLYSYLKQVSGGKVRLETVSPQTDGATGRIAYLDLPKKRADYANSELIAYDAVAAFSQAYASFDATILDSDKDGFADNVLIVPDANGSAPVFGDALWPKQGTIGSSISLGASGRSVKVGSFTLVDTTHLMAVGTVIHETLHSFGAKDLYRAGTQVNGDADKPVGVWDIMAEHGGSKLMWPLAISRQDCGWVSIPETNQTTCTLYAPSSGKTQAVKIKTDLSASEYFVVEYRKANYDITDLSALDTSSEGSPMTIGGSGLVVYRVNPAVSDVEAGNKGEKDYVYVFREGETGGPRGDGVWKVPKEGAEDEYDFVLRSAQLSSSARTSLGTEDLSKGLADGAITYSSGQNSGLVISIASETDDSVTFNIKYPNLDENDMWREAIGSGGVAPLASTAATETVVESDGIAVFQLCTDFFGKKASVLRFDGTNWTVLGTVGSGCQKFDLACVGGAVYACGVDFSSNRVTLWRWSGSGTSWVQVASLTVSANYAVLGDVGGTLHMFVAGMNAGGQLYRLEGSALKAVGGSISTASVNACDILDRGGSPSLVYSEFAQSGSATKLAHWSGSAWSSKVLSSGISTTVDAAVLDGVGYVALVSNSRLSLVKVDASGATSTMAVPSSIPAVSSAALAVGGGGLHLGVNHVGAGDGGKVEVFRLGAGAWDKVGFDVVSSATGVDVTTTSREIFCASSDTRVSRASLHRHELVSGSDPLPSWKIAAAPRAVNQVYTGKTLTGVAAGVGYTVQGGSATAVGTYTATATLAEGYAWNAAGDRAPKKLTWKVLPAPSVAYSTHVQNIGWQAEVRDGARGGTSGRSLRVEGFKVRLVNQPCAGSVRVSAHVQNVGWQGWAYDGALAGTSGRSLRVEALRIELTGEMAERYDVYYRAHVQNVGDTGWARNGEPCGSSGRSWRMEAVYIRLVPKGGAAPGPTANRFVHPLVTYSTHVQNVGWQAAVSDGATGGTSGRSLRVEAFRVSLDSPECAGSVRVSSHVQNVGWQGWRYDGAVSGTSGRSLRVEALKVELTGEMAGRYDVWYRTHCQNVGWTGWARNGAPSGTAGYSYRMEAVQIRLVPKGGAAPGSTARAFYQKN